MIRSVTRWDWRPGAVATLIILAALAVCTGTGVGLVWVSNTYDVGALAHTLLLVLIVTAVLADVGYLTRTGKCLHQAYRRQP